MSACPDKIDELHALMDGELDPVNAQAVEAHLKACPACAAALSELQGLSARLASPALREAAPASLRASVEGMLAAETARAPRRVPRGLPWALSGGFAAAFAASVAMMAVMPATASLETQLVDNHVRSTLAAHLVDVETSDRHTVKPWFNGKIDFAPPVVDLAPQGFPLIGGRVDYLQGKVVAALVYRRNKHVINVFIRPEQAGLRWPIGEAGRDGYSLVRWTENGLEFWAVSDVERGDLEALRAAFKAQTGA